MIKAGLALLLGCITIATSAQDLKIGLTGGINTTWLLNKNVADAGDHLNVMTTFGFSAGLNTIYSFSEHAGISLSIIFSNHNQKYQGEIQDISGNTAVEYESFLNLTYFDVPLLFRFQSPKGPYLEIGPQFGFLINAQEDFTISKEIEFVENYQSRRFKNNFQKTNVAAIMGVGFDYDASEKIAIATGLRFGYGFTDVTREFTKMELEILSATNTLSYTSAISHQGENLIYSYEPSTRFFGGFLIGVAYKL
ncbi:MAG: porin family protein [Bacteroidia bacterium]